MKFIRNHDGSYSSDFNDYAKRVAWFLITKDTWSNNKTNWRLWWYDTNVSLACDKGFSTLKAAKAHATRMEEEACLEVF